MALPSSTCQRSPMPRLVPDAIASALDLVVQGREQSLDALRRRLSDRNMLIVLDNFEQVLDAAPVIADLLQRAPHLHVLVTSRVALRVRGEQEWRVDALEVPPATGDPAELARTPALRLFVDRVRDVQAGIRIDERERAGRGRVVPPIGRSAAGVGTGRGMDAAADTGTDAQPAVRTSRATRRPRRPARSAADADQHDLVEL